MPKTDKLFRYLLSLFCAIFLIISIGCDAIVTRKVTVMYYKDGGIYSSINFEVTDGGKITGDPSDWGNRTWKKGITGDFGYVDDNNVYHYFSADADGNYNFKLTTSGDFSTSEAVKGNIVITPVYSSVSSRSSAIFVYYKSESKMDITSGTITESVTEHRYKQEISKGLDGTYKFNPSSALTYVTSENSPVKDRLTVDDELGYGYIDYNDHGRRWVMDPKNVTIKDSSGNIYPINESIDIQGDSEFYFNYLDGGYHSTQDYFGYNLKDGSFEAITADMVYIPGTTDSEGKVYPWPNSQGGFEGNVGFKYYLEDGNSFVSDVCDYSHPIHDLLVMDTPVSQSFINNISQDNVFNVEYQFHNPSEPTLAFSSLPEGGMPHKDVPGFAWNSVSLLEAMVMANLLTYKYNVNAKYSDKNFTPLTPVYFNADGSELKKTTDVSANTFKRAVIVKNENTGFRLLTSNEWEYCAKVVVDERQLPDFNDETIGPVANILFHRKGGNEGYRFNFQNSNEGKYNIYNHVSNGSVNYSASGAGLATPTRSDEGFLSYNSKSLRTAYRAMGRDNNGSTRESEFTAGTLITKVNYEGTGAVDYNLRNGAGLWNMTGFMYTYLGTPYSGTNNTPSGQWWVSRGGDYKIANNSAFRIPYVKKATQLNTSCDNYTCVRYCRTIYK